MTRSLRQGPRGLAIALVLLALALVMPLSAQAQGETVLRGTLRHGGDNPSFDPTTVTVSLNVLEGVQVVQEQSTRPDASGAFEFNIAHREGRAYFLTADYQGATYSASRNASNLGEPVTIEVFEATHDPSVIKFESYTIIVTGALPNEGFVEVLERAVVRNDSGMTLVPDREAAGPEMLSFLRFALPEGYYNLDVGSTLVGGTVLDVGPGFALDMPIPPTGEGPHEFQFVYRLPYEGSELDLSRTMRFGAEVLHVVSPVDVGRPSSSVLRDLGVAEQNQRLLRLLEGSDIAPGATLDLRLTELPVPSLWDRVSASAGEWYLRFGVPLAVVLVGVVLLAVGFRQRPRAVPVLAEAARSGRSEIIDRLRELEARYEAGGVSHRRYETEREALRRALVRAEVRARLSVDEL